MPFLHVICIRGSMMNGPWVGRLKLTPQYIIYDFAGMKSEGLECIVLDVCFIVWQDIAAVVQTMQHYSRIHLAKCPAAVCHWNIWILWLPLHFCLSFSLFPFFPLPFPFVSSTVSHPYRNGCGLSVHSTANDTSTAKSSLIRQFIQTSNVCILRRLWLWAYSNVLIKILVNLQNK